MGAHLLTPMTLDELRQAAKAHIAPILAARVLDHTAPCPARAGQACGDSLVELLGPTEIGLRTAPEEVESLVIARAAPFEPVELQLARDFASELLLIHDGVAGEFRQEVLSFLSERALTRHLGAPPALRTVLSQFNRWTRRSYEGAAISSAIGIDPDARGGDLALEDYFAEEFSTALGNGYDTLLVTDGAGRLLGTEQLEMPRGGVAKAPYRFSAIANWCTGNRIALLLNHRGEQVIFRNRMMVCTKLWGKWLYNTYEMYLDQINPPQDRKLREEIYQTCLDVSWARCGGCLVVVRSGAMDAVATMVSENDRLDRAQPASRKAAMLRLLGGRRFQDMDRRLRQELLAIDGATVISETGDIIAIGAILSVPSGSHGGGRHSAALRGSELGLGIKMSEDGALSIFRNGKLSYDAS